MPTPAQTRYTDPRAHALRARYVETFGGAEVPVAVEAIAEDLLGLRIEQAWDLGDCSGMLIPAERLIRVNANEATHDGEPIRRQRFTIAHELGHWICHARTAPSYCRLRDLTEDTDRSLEREANVFAAELLLPEPAVREAWAKEPSVEACAELLGVSRLSAQWRLYSFGLVADKPA